MNRNRCTHLIISKPAGNKYKFAREWQMHIVTPQWLDDSVASGYCLAESDYRFDVLRSSTT